MYSDMFCSAIIVAGGSGKRMGKPIAKQYLELCGEPIIKRTVDVFLNSGAIGPEYKLTVPPIASARSSSSLKFSALPTPRPPDTRILASMISTVSDTALTTSLMVTYLLFGVNPGLYSSITAFAPAIGAIFCITPGRTVAI